MGDVLAGHGLVELVMVALLEAEGGLTGMNDHVQEGAGKESMTGVIVAGRYVDGRTDLDRVTFQQKLGEFVAIHR